MRALYAAASGMYAQQVKIDVVANNLANANTPGYKAARAQFQDLLYDQLLHPGEAQSRNGIQVGQGVRLAAVDRVFSDGALQPTDRPLDLAIRGPGFFRVQRETGVEALTRDGAFRLDVLRRLVNQQGMPVLGENGPIRIPEGAQRLDVAMDGTVRYPDPETGTPVLLARLQLTTVPNPDGLLAFGHNLWESSQSSGDPMAGFPTDAGFGEIIPGHLEGSNVEVVSEMVNLIVAQRAYEINSRALQAADEVSGMANNLRR